MIKHSWDDFSSAMEVLSRKILDDKFAPDILIAVSRGGWVPAIFLSRILKVKKMASIGISYENETRTTFNVYSMPSLTADIKSVLVIEDRLESAKSIKAAKDIFERECLNVHTCALYTHSKSILIPDYFINATDEEIILPWEI